MNKKIKKNITIDDLATMVQQGFAEAEKRNDVRFANLEQGQAKLEQGQEDIKMRLDNVAYRFELVELQKRVQLLEDRVLQRKK